MPRALALQSRVAGTHLSGINLDSQMERNMYKRKSDLGTFRSDENLEELLLAAQALLLPLETRLTSTPYPPGRQASKLGHMSTTPPAGHLPPHQSPLASREPWLWAVMGSEVYDHGHKRHILWICLHCCGHRLFPWCEDKTPGLPQ